MLNRLIEINMPRHKRQIFVISVEAIDSIYLKILQKQKLDVPLEIYHPLIQRLNQLRVNILHHRKFHHHRA